MREKKHRFRFAVLGLFLPTVAVTLCTDAAELDPSRLPPPAHTNIDFTRDIRPIFEQSCLRCHGPERPKSHFRLDNRESAIKGGDNGIDIIPTNSAKSPLIFYVARLVPDMEMPPDGKGEPLTTKQVALLRAWIDQGASWGATNPAAAMTYFVEPTLRYISVSGDKSKFREVEGIREGTAGGVQRFAVQEQLGPDKILSLEGRAIVPDNDYQLKLELRKTDFGFVRGGFEEWRKYYDDSGGYYQPFSPSQFDQHRDLYLDTGRAWVDFGLTIPFWPQIVLGYEYQFKEGDKSTLEWGNVAGKNIYPASENINEHTHIAKLDVTYDLLGFHLEDNARVELYNLTTLHHDSGSFSTGPTPDTSINTKDGASHVQGANTLRVERQVTDWWLASAGYLYSKLDGDASLQQATIDPAGLPASGQFWSADTTLLKRESQIFSVASSLVPIKWFTASAGVQGEWTQQDGAGTVHLDSGDPNIPSLFLYPAMVRSDLDEQKWSENGQVRFNAIPWTVLFGEGRLEQDRIGQYEADEPLDGVTPDKTTTFLRNTDYSNNQKEFRGGFDTSPLRWFSLGGHYKSRTSNSDYDNSKLSLDPTGYSAFIRARKIDTDEWQGKLVLKPTTWLKTTLTYQKVTTEYSTETDPVPGGLVAEALSAADYRAHVYGINATLTPFQRVFLSGAFTYSDSRIATAQNGDPSIVPYDGKVYTVVASASYVLDKATQLSASYAFSRADYSQNNVVSGLPLGLDYNRDAASVGITRKWTKRLSSTLRYGFYKYSDPSTGGLNNYTAHGIFASLVYKGP
ncbi:MAG TPA: c-type cytochrome domain-containing protein [Candidatus Dormibacteraeota bacterium]|nr:c-type cytochrome domain-containing protein [Candidatus Dormibacteraeota bacterium]